MENLKTMARADWAPAIERTARNTAAVLVAVYTAGYVTGELLHKMNDALTDLIHRIGTGWLTRLGLLVVDAFVPAPDLAPMPVIIHRQEPERLTIAPPTGVSAIHLLAADGISQRAIADILGITRYQVRKALA